MIVKLVRVEDFTKETSKGEKEFKRLICERADNGEEYKKEFASWSTTLMNQLATVGPGDWLDLGYDSTKYKNLKSIKEARPDDVEAAKNYKSKGNKDDTGAKNFRRADGGSRGDDTNRASAIYLAKDIVLNVGDTKESGRLDHTLHVIGNVADAIYAYIKDGKKLEEAPWPNDAKYKNAKPMDAGWEPPEINED